jgi:hypothetical protein
MRGFITDVDCQTIDEEFPGIWQYYEELEEKPCTFLELWWSFIHRGEACAEGSADCPVASRAATNASR